MDAFELIMDDSQLDQSSAKALLAFESAFRIATVSIGAAGGNMGRVSRIMTHDPFYTGNFSIIFPVFCDHESIIAYLYTYNSGIRPLIFHEATPQHQRFGARLPNRKLIVNPAICRTFPTCRVGPGNFPPVEPLTELDVTVSRHPAFIIKSLGL